MIRSYIGAGFALLTWRIGVTFGVGWATFAAACWLLGLGLLDMAVRFGKRAAGIVGRPKAAA